MRTDLNMINSTASRNLTVDTNNLIVIGIDHGFGNIKTANTVFKTGVTAYDKEPIFKSNLLTWQGRFYQIGEEHKEFTADKIQDEDYYILTLAAIVKELHSRGLASARVHIAAGLPLTWVREQKDSFREYLLQNESADFTFKETAYHVNFAGADIFPQGFAAVSDLLRDFTGINMLADIGNGTMNVMYINERKPVEQKSYTEKFGTNQCMIAIREKLMSQFNVSVDEAILERVIRYGTANISERFLEAIRESEGDYVSGIFRRLREHEYSPELMRLFVTGGGGCLIKNFGEYDPDRVIFIDDIRATVKGYEMLAKRKLRKAGMIV